MADKKDLLEHLKQLTDPLSGKDIVAAGLVSGVVVKDKSIGFALEVDPSLGKNAEPLRREAEEIVRSNFPNYKVTVVLTSHLQGGDKMSEARKELPKATPKPKPPPGKLPLPGIKHIIAIASGKGGVGKSTTAVNLAAAFAKQGVRTGLLDADVYGPSIPKMLGLHQSPKLDADKKLIPLEKHGLKIMSMGFMVEEDSPMIWRGPMIISALRQMLEGVRWANKNQELDLLVVDMPPGTGDAQLTLAQRAPLTGAVIISTPQDIALIDARKGLRMFEKVDVPVLGLIENMSVFICPHCGEESHIFGHNGGVKEAKKLSLPLLGQIPLHMEIRTLSDAGTPVVTEQPDSEFAAYYLKIASALWNQISTSPYCKKTESKTRATS